MNHHPFTLRSALITFGIGIMGLCLLGYIAFQARYLITGPQLQLHVDPGVVHNERVVALVGSAKNVSRVTLNGRPMYTDEDGNFTQKLVLENGYTMATLRAFDRYGRTSTIAREFVFRPASFIE